MLRVKISFRLPKLVNLPWPTINLPSSAVLPTKSGKRFARLPDSLFCNVHNEYISFRISAGRRRNGEFCWFLYDMSIVSAANISQGAFPTHTSKYESLTGCFWRAIILREVCRSTSSSPRTELSYHCTTNFLWGC
jgi:hypothetical protein